MTSLKNKIAACTGLALTGFSMAFGIAATANAAPTATANQDAPASTQGTQGIQLAARHCHMITKSVHNTQLICNG